MMAETMQVGTNYIVKTPGMLGGRARIEGRRIAVSDVVNLHIRLRTPIDEIAEVYNLTLAQVYAALAYYYDHQDEIDSYLDRLYKSGKEEADEEAIARKRTELEARHPNMAQRIQRRSRE